jgi:Outer membrane protein beta-barrel domain
MDGCKLNLRNIVVLVIAMALLQPLLAQDCDEECKVNDNIAMVVNVPVNSTAQVAGIGWGAVAGIGYNFNQRHAVIGEFMWNRVYPSNGSLQPLQAALPSSNLSANADLFTLTGNYRFELRGRLLGTYLIGGGGWYFRDTNLSSKVTAGSGTICTPVWLWWGFTCTSGTVTAGQTVTSSHSNALGANAGIGFTVRVGEAPYRLYTEARYHYAPTKNIETQFIAATLGIRY